MLLQDIIQGLYDYVKVFLVFLDLDIEVAFKYPCPEHFIYSKQYQTRRCSLRLSQKPFNLAQIVNKKLAKYTHPLFKFLLLQ